MSNRPRIHIGNQTAFSAPSVLEPFDYAVQQGFDAFEWFPDRKPWGGWDDTNLDPAARLEIRRHAATHGIRLSVHARWQANPLQAEAWPVLWRDVALAEDLGAALLNIHLEAGQGVETYVRAITPLVQRVGELGLQLALENTPLTTPPHFNELFARLHALESVATSHVGMCFDLGHANLCAATRHDYLKYLDELGAHVPLIHLHVHENWGDHDSHLPLFTGPAGRDDAGVRGFIQRLRQRNLDCLAPAGPGHITRPAELDDQDRVLARQPDEHDKADLGENVDIHAGEPYADPGPEKAHGHDQNHG